jgi:hypothetical protein
MWLWNSVLTVMEEHSFHYTSRYRGLKREEITRGWRKLRNENLNSMYSTTNSVRKIKLMKTGWEKGTRMQTNYQKCIQNSVRKT